MEGEVEEGEEEGKERGEEASATSSEESGGQKGQAGSRKSEWVGLVSLKEQDRPLQ